MKDMVRRKGKTVADDLPVDGFNAPLYTAKAFGIATLIVAVCASTVVWGVKIGMGVKDVRSSSLIYFLFVCLFLPFFLSLPLLISVVDIKTQEFADRMRHPISTRLPFLTYRIHRHPPERSDSSSGVDIEWKWGQAEERIEVGEQDKWTVANLQEMEHCEKIDSNITADA